MLFSLTKYMVGSDALTLVMAQDLPETDEVPHDLIPQTKIALTYEFQTLTAVTENTRKVLKMGPASRTSENHLAGSWNTQQVS